MQGNAFRYAVQSYQEKNSKAMKKMAQLEWLNSPQNKDYEHEREEAGIMGKENNDSLLKVKEKITVGIRRLGSY